MARIDLQVPFAEKDAAKRLGARWDGERKVWFIPDGVDPSPFNRWLPNEAEFNLRAPSYFIAEAVKACWKCREPTRVYGFVLPAEYEALEEAEEDLGKEAWTSNDEPTIVSYITELLPTVSARITQLSRHYRVDVSKTAQSSYWMNHCEQCGVKQGDFELYHEPDGPFFLTSEVEASQVTLHRVEEPFGCAGEYSYEVHFFADMRRK